MKDSNKTKEQLLREVQLLRTLIDTLPERLYVKDKKGRFIICNKAVGKDVDKGFTGDPVGKTDFDLFLPENADEFHKDEKKVIKSGKPIVNKEVSRISRKDGKPSWALCTKLPWKDKNGRVIGIIGSNRDITERKKAEQALHESEIRYTTIFESAQEGILIADVETKKIKYANPSLCRMFGYTEEEFCKKNVNDIHGKENVKEIKDSFAMHKQHRGGKQLNHVSCRRKDGTVFFAGIKIVVIKIDHKMCHLVFFTDTTKRKNTEDALRESEGRYKTIFESAREGIIVVDVETTQFRYANPALCKMFGYTEKEFCRMSLSDIHPKESRDEVTRDFEAKSQGIRELSKNIPCLRKDRTLFYADIMSTSTVMIDRRVCVVGLFMDITERKKSEDALKESEARYKAIFDSAKEGILVADTRTKQFKYANPAICEMFGYSEEELRQMTVKDIHPKEHLPVVIGHFKEMAEGRSLQANNTPCIRKDGSIFYADINTAVVSISNCLCSIGFFNDITERKRSEEALRESEQRFRLLVEQLPAVTYTAALDDTNTTVYVSPQIQQILGFSPDDYKADPDIWRKLLHPDDRNRVIRDVEETQRKDKPFSCEYRMIAKDGTVVWVSDDARIVKDSKGRPLYLQGVMYDISERKKAEEMLRQSEEKFRGMAERSSELIFITDTKGFITYLSPASEKIFGYKPEEMVGEHFMNFLVKTEIPRAVKRFRDKLKGKEQDILYLEAKKKNGSHVFIELSSSLIKQDGKIAGTQGIIKDVSERKKAEERIQKAHEELEARVKQRTSDLANAIDNLQKEIAVRKKAEESLMGAEKRFRTIFENTLVGLYRTTPSGKMLIANPALVKMMGCKSFDELAKFDIEKYGYDPSTPRSIFKNLIKKHGSVIGLDSIWRRPDGSKLFVSDSAFAVKDAKGKILYYEGTAEDITKRKEAEAKLMLYQQQLRSLATELSLAEERLRRRIAAELHDHIAQNLAISKIKLESMTGEIDDGMAKSLKEVIELLSSTIDTSRSLTFEISPPVLYELGFEAAISWLARQTRHRFGLEIDVINDQKPKPLNSDIRGLLFQAVRELLVNIIKHAKAKKAAISISKDDHKIKVIVKDDGMGFDIDKLNIVKDFTKGGFGLFNIRERLDQIGGNVIINSSHKKGTEVIMTAPIEKDKDSQASLRPQIKRKNMRKK